MNTKEDDRQSLGSIIDTALEIAERRRETLRRLRAALKARRTAEVVDIAEELCGLSHDETSDRVN